jgi:creatinine amidohydrolase
MRYLLWCSVLLVVTSAVAQKNKNSQAVYLEDISWKEAAKVLTPSAVVVIPLGAGAKEHGPHLPLSTDKIQAEYFTTQVALNDSVVIAPTISYSYYPPFLKYAGSTSLRLTTSRDMLLEIVRSLAAYGPKRFYVINQGITTTAVLAMTAAILRQEGIVLYYSDYMRKSYDDVARSIRTQATGTHADELETSHILLMQPGAVNMQLAVDDTTAKVRTGPSLSPVKIPNTTLSPSGVFGYATLATRKKGEASAKAILQLMLREIDSVHHCALPPVTDNAAAYAEYTGTYQYGDGKQLIIKFEDNHLQYVLNGADLTGVYPLQYYGHDRFGSQLLDIVFVRDESRLVQQALCSNQGGEFATVKKNTP